MGKIHVTSEIAPLKKVLLHRPGKELLNLTPDSLNRLLFDDIPYLPDAIIKTKWDRSCLSRRSYGRCFGFKWRNPW